MRTTEKQLRDGKAGIDDMRYDLAELEAMNLNTSDVIQILIEGYEGLDNQPDIEVRDEWKRTFGEKGEQ